MTWQRAEETWLGTAARRSAHTERAYRNALNDFKRFISPRGLGEIGGGDVAAWANDLAQRGLAESTINARLAALSSFYRFCMTSFTDEHGIGLIGFNPVSAVERARITPYGKSRPLSPEQVRTLLDAVNRSTVQGMRDYAMILMAVFTGRRSAEIRHLRWGDIMHTADGRVRYHWRGKGGKERWDDLPQPVYDAICLYLEVAGRTDLHTDDYIFVSLNGDNEPLSSEWYNQTVKRYAQAAGLPAWVHAHTLRHTAAHLRVRAGQSVLEIQRLLGHANLRITQIYLNAQGGFQDTGWQAVQEVLAGSNEVDRQ